MLDDSVIWYSSLEKLILHGQNSSLPESTLHGDIRKVGKNSHFLMATAGSLECVYTPVFPNSLGQSRKSFTGVWQCLTNFVPVGWQHISKLLYICH